MPSIDRRLRLAALAAVLAAGGVAVAVAVWPGRPQDGDAADRLVLGHRLYGEYCASCHGADLEGQPNWRERGPDGLLPAPPHDATGHTWHHPDRQLLAITKHGTAAVVGGGYRTNMAGFGEVLSDAEIRAVLDYIKSTWPDQIRSRQADITARTDG